MFDWALQDSVDGATRELPAEPAKFSSRYVLRAWGLRLCVLALVVGMLQDYAATCFLAWIIGLDCQSAWYAPFSRRLVLVHMPGIREGQESRWDAKTSADVDTLDGSSSKGFVAVWSGVETVPPRFGCQPDGGDA